MLSHAHVGKVRGVGKSQLKGKLIKRWVKGGHNSYSELLNQTKELMGKRKERLKGNLIKI
jgi:hypothetical protein